MERISLLFLFLFFLIFFVGFIGATTCEPGQCVVVGADGCLDVGDVYGGQYCNFNSVLTDQLGLGDACSNNFECFNSECIDNVCSKKSQIITGGAAEISLWDKLSGIVCTPGSDIEGEGWKCEDNLYYSCGSLGVWEGGVEREGYCGITLHTQDTCTPDTEETDCTDIPEAQVTCSVDGEVINQSFAGECIASEDGVNSCSYIPGDFEVVDVCDSGKVCSEGECIVLPSCTPGEEMCANSVNNICNNDGDWVAQSPVEGVCGYSSGGGGGGGGGSSMRVVISSPQNTTYSSKSVPLNVYDSRHRAKYWRYSLNGAEKTKFVPNTTLLAREGLNSLSVYASKYSSHSGEASRSTSFRVVSSSGNGGCGDGVCSVNENEFICSQDCSSGYCGDGVCSASEEPSSCSSDCTEVVSSCDDGVCDYSDGENSANCPSDCEPVEPTSWVWLFVVIIILILLAIIVVIFFIYQRLKNRSEDEQRSSNNFNSGNSPKPTTGGTPNSSRGFVGQKPMSKRSSQPFVPQGNVSTMPVSSAPKKIPRISSQGNITSGSKSPNPKITREPKSSSPKNK